MRIRFDGRGRNSPGTDHREKKRLRIMEGLARKKEVTLLPVGLEGFPTRLLWKRGKASPEGEGGKGGQGKKRR